VRPLVLVLPAALCSVLMRALAWVHYQWEQRIARPRARATLDPCGPRAQARPARRGQGIVLLASLSARARLGTVFRARRRAVAQRPMLQDISTFFFSVPPPWYCNGANRT
jgi:hypothetical protein